jgi:ABC-type transport system substrate-binding protein
MPFMAVYNNLVRFDPAKPRNSFDTIIPELATGWEWDATKTKLTFKLRSDVQWHDGKPFTAKDVQCTFHRLNGKEPDYLRRNPRGIWYEHLTEVTLNGDYEVTFVLSQPQPSLLAMLASGYTAIYPCHVSGRDMRVKPIGTGPFKFVEFRSNEAIRLARNADYWKKGQPYLDAIEWRIVPNRSTRLLAFAAGEFDLTQTADVTPPLLNDVKKNAPGAICALLPTNVTTHMLVNREKPPFDNPQLRHAMLLSLDRQAFIDILSLGKANLAVNMMPPPEGNWGMPIEELKKLPSYGDPVAQREEARKIMENLGYGPGRDPRRPAQQDPFRRRARRRRVFALVQSPLQEGLRGRAQSRRCRHRRSRRRPEDGLRVQVGSEFLEILQPRDRQAAGRAVAGARCGEAKGDRVEDRAHPCGGRRSADHLPWHRGDLLACPLQRPRPARELDLQQLAVR